MPNSIENSISTTTSSSNFSTSDEEASSTKRQYDVAVGDNRELSPLSVPDESDRLPVSQCNMSREAVLETVIATSSEEARDADDENDDEEEEEELMLMETENFENNQEMAINVANQSAGSERQISDSGEEMNDEEDESDDHLILLNTSFNNPLSSKDKLIHVGADYQAVINPPSEKSIQKREEIEDRDLCIWDCNTTVDGDELDDYILHATGRLTLPIDRALYILTKCKNDFETAYTECEQRRQLREVWPKEEKNLFQQAIHKFGKRFKKIKEAMPDRSMGSIVQFYYDTKVEMEYKKYFVEEDGTPDPYDEVMEEIRKSEKIESGSCENCGKHADIMIYNKQVHRNECKPCVLFFRIMHRPRPSAINGQEAALRKNMAICPEYHLSDMRNYVNGAYDLREPADGKAYERLGFGPEFAPKVDVDDDLQVLDSTTTDFPSGPYRPAHTNPDEPVDENTCRMTRTFEDENGQKILKNLRKRMNVCTPVVWRVKENKCMEDIRFLNDESRVQMGKAFQTWDRVNTKHVSNMKTKIDALRHRCGSNFFDPTNDVPESTGAASRSGKIRCDSNWTQREKTDCIRCLHWYPKDFKACAEVMGTKTAEQVEVFYMEHKERIEKSIAAYTHEVSSKAGV